MQKFFLFILLSGLLLFCFSQEQQDVQDRQKQLKAYSAAEQQYQQAKKLATRAGDDEALQAKADAAYQQALASFTALLTAAEGPGNDSLLFFTRLRTGFIHYYFDSASAAKKDYLQLISLRQKLPSVADSFLFLPYLYTGGLYYNQNQFDSALYWYKKAEQVNDSYSFPLDESPRLYNRLGAMYYETGNYRQAKNYFEKAISLTPASNQNLLVNYKINIASLLVKLDEQDDAKFVYESLLPSPAFANEINHNLGIISFKKQEYKKAIDYLRKVNYTDSRKTIDLYYNFGVAYAALKETDSSAWYLQKALAENSKWNGRKKNITYGLLLKFQAEELAKKQLFNEAIDRYQQATLQFHPAYTETDGYKNPDQFTGVFSFINLFNSLAGKAATFESWYQQTSDIEVLKASLAAYQSAFKLADYVEKTYDSDEARLFLGKIKYTEHSKPIDICLQLYGLTKKRYYLEEAYLFDQRNKASLLSLQIRENEWRNQSGKELIRQEADLKKTITRLTLNAAKTSDSLAMLQVNAAIRDQEIELGKLQQQLKNEPAWQQKNAASQIPSIDQLQKKLDNTTALVSFHLSEHELLILLITPGRFEYFKTAINTNFFTTITTFKQALQATSQSQRYNGTTAAISLYKTLIEPLQPRLSQIRRLIIIPDDELHYLPFEALQDENKKYLVEQFSIQYQYSTALLGKKPTVRYLPGTLSFAPFASKGFTNSSGLSLSSLPASREEVAKLEGAHFIDSAATRKNFLQSVNSYGTLHLATHASVNNEDPSRSFIAFYPGDNDSRLHALEITDLPLDSTGLVILSACETGTGQLVKGEGLMSLSRAFAAAGCPNIITSLWKAEDKTTAFLTKQLHYYLDKHFTRDKALQQAKKDLLNSKEIDPRLKSPVYWAHLILIGEYENKQSTSKWWWIALAIVVGSLAYLLIKKKNQLVK